MTHPRPETEPLTPPLLHLAHPAAPPPAPAPRPPGPPGSSRWPAANPSPPRCSRPGPPPPPDRARLLAGAGRAAAPRPPHPSGAGGRRAGSRGRRCAAGAGAGPERKADRQWVRMCRQAEDAPGPGRFGTCGGERGTPASTGGRLGSGPTRLRNGRATHCRPRRGGPSPPWPVRPPRRRPRRVLRPQVTARPPRRRPRPGPPCAGPAPNRDPRRPGAAPYRRASARSCTPCRPRPRRVLRPPVTRTAAVHWQAGAPVPTLGPCAR
jgi:hypothetical protein